MQISKESLSLELGLKALTLEPQLVHSPSSHHHHHNMISDLLSPTTSFSLLSGDYIGMESCDDVVNDTALVGVDRQNSYSQKLRGKREERLAMKRKEFPPPIPLLARTENLPSHMPWILKRHYTSDGRLILTEEKVRHHEYFMAHRSNGRLRLQLVPLDDDGRVWAPPLPHPHPSVCCDEEGCECDGDDDHDDNVDGYDDENEDGDGDDEKDEEGDTHLVEESSNGGHNSNIGGGGGSSSSSSNNNGKCLNFNSVGTGSPCIFGVPVPAIRQVLS